MVSESSKIWQIYFFLFYVDFLHIDKAVYIIEGYI